MSENIFCLIKQSYVFLFRSYIWWHFLIVHIWNSIYIYTFTATSNQLEKNMNLHISCFETFFTYLQWTEMGPSWPNCSFVLCTWPMKSINPSPDFGTPCSGQSVNWNCLTVRDWPSFNKRHKQCIPKARSRGW